jgi:D-alanyl-D-alanine carboxypeptidase
MYKPLIGTLTFLCVWGMSVAQPLDRKKLDSFFTVLAERNLAMGSIAISKNGKVVYQRAMGDARIENRDTVAADGRTEYRIGSISKMFTAVIIFQLLEEKKLSIDDRLSTYFPQLPKAGSITIGNLLDHRSGLPDFTRNTGFDDWKEKPKTSEELLALIAGRAPDFAPNAKADYNNSNYLVLSFIIEKICRKAYSAVLYDRVIGKLGLLHTYYAHNATLSRYEAGCYKYFGHKWVRGKDAWLDNFKGAGAIISTPTDMLVFINALFAGRLVSTASLHTMETMVDGYGMGLFPFSLGDHHGFGHNGQTEGFSSSLTYYPDDKLAIAYCTNGEVYSKSFILDGVRAMCFGMPFTVPTFLPVTLPTGLLDQYSGHYVSNRDGLDVVVTRNGGELVLAFRGQKFTLTAVDSKRFWSQPFGLFFDFDRVRKGLTIIDVEAEYGLEKQ